MKISFVCLFPNLISPYFKESILARALKNGLFELNFINPRSFSKNAHKKVDDYKIGGGAGLLMSSQPLFDALSSIKSQNSHTIFLSPSGKKFNQKDAKRLSKKNELIFVCGRYEGIDERVIEEEADEIFSIGDFILTGGELGALVMCDAILRNLSGVLGNAQSLEEESFENDLLEAPAFTKPFTFKKNSKFLKTPSAFLKGNRAKIADLKINLATCKTQFFRPDLFLKYKRKK